MDLLVLLEVCVCICCKMVLMLVDRFVTPNYIFVRFCVCSTLRACSCGLCVLTCFRSLSVACVVVLC